MGVMLHFGAQGGKEEGKGRKMKEKEWRETEKASLQSNETSRISDRVLLDQPRKKIGDVCMFLSKRIPWKGHQFSLHLFHMRVRAPKNPQDKFSQCFLIHLYLLVRIVPSLQDLEAHEEGLDLVQGFPSDEGFKRSKSNGDLGFMIRVSKLFRISLVQLPS